MQQTINELMALCTSLQRQYLELAVKFEAQKIEITRNLDEGEATAERASDDIEEMPTVLTSMDAAIVLASRAAEVPTGSGSIPTAGPSATKVPTGSDVVPTASPVFATTTVVTPYRRRKGKEVMGYHYFASELPIERRIELISDLVKYQDNYAKIYKFLSQQRKPSTKKQKRDYYMAVIRSNLGWKKLFKSNIPLLTGRFTQRVRELTRRLQVKETLSNRQPTSDKEMELWVELSRLYEPDDEDQLWTHTQNLMHAPVEWKLYDTCRVHHVTAKDKEIFMLVEKEYPLRKGLDLVMISYKLQVENYSRMANDLILKIYKIASTPRQQGEGWHPLQIIILFWKLDCSWSIKFRGGLLGIKYTRHSHCQVIKFRDSYEVPASTTSATITNTTSGETSKKSGRTVTLTAEDLQKKKNDVYESKVQKKLEPNSQNMAFISLAKHSSGNEDGNTASVSTASTNVSTACANIGVASIRQDTACAYIDFQSNSSQIKFEDINQIDEDDMEEIDIKWSMALLSMRADKAPKSQDKGRRDNYKQGSKVKEQAPKALMAIDGVGWDWSYMANDGEDHALVAVEEAPT
nr:hypothetical protein [Tanacetum cinerariifolium]